MPAIALVTGALLALCFGNPYLATTKRWTPRLLQASIVGLGAGMDLGVVGRVGLQGILYTLVGLTLTLVLSRLVGQWLDTGSEISALLGVGTAVCGGSAIAAVSPVIRAKDESTTVALATIFLLNATALLIFPIVGHWSGLDQRQFGLFSALAIHDTSSVVGATLQYGPEALMVGTTVKLARALWIVPVTLAFAFVWKKGAKSSAQTPKPWFILGFLASAALVTWIPALSGIGAVVAEIARYGLIATLFLIGSGLTRATLRKVGVRPFVHGLTLWLAVSAATWGSIQLGWIR